MPTINVNVTNKIATGDRQTIICDNTDYVVHFNLDSEWDNLTDRTMRVLLPNGNYYDVEFTGTEVALPLITGARGVCIGIYAGSLHTTTQAYFSCSQSVLGETSGEQVAPIEDIFGELLDMKWGTVDE